MRRTKHPLTLMGRAENLNPGVIVGNETSRHGYRREAVIIRTSGRGRGYPITGFMLGLASVAAIIAMFWPVLS